MLCINFAVLPVSLGFAELARSDGSLRGGIACEAKEYDLSGCRIRTEKYVVAMLENHFFPLYYLPDPL
jgi:hypothetical protein